MNGPSGIEESKDSIAIAPAAIDCKGVNVVGKPHPMLSDTIQCSVPEGETLSQILVGLNFDYISVRLNGEYVPKEMWRHIRPKAGSNIEVIALPQGNSRTWKTVGAIAIAIAVTIASAGIMGPGAATFGGVYGAAAVASGVAIVGTLATYALLSPLMETPELKQEDNSAKSFTGTSNRAAPYSVQPIVFGTHVMYPPHAAMPYTQMIADKQNMYVMLDCGPGQLTIDQIKIGGTPIADYDAVWEIGPQPRLFSNDHYEKSIGYQFSEADDQEGVPQITESKYTEQAGNEVGIDITFPVGLIALNGEGKTRGGHTKICIEYRVGTGPWKNLWEEASSGRLGIIDKPSGLYGGKLWVSSPERFAEDADGPVNQTNTYIGSFQAQHASGYPVTNYGAVRFYAGQIAPPTIPVGGTFSVTEPAQFAGKYRVHAIDGDYLLLTTPEGNPVPWLLSFRGETEGMAVVIATESQVAATYGYWTITSNDKKGFTFSIAWVPEETKELGSPGIVEVRITRGAIWFDAGATQKMKSMIWTVLRSNQWIAPFDNNLIAGTRVAMQLVANTELQGNIQQISCRVRQSIPVWDGTVATKNTPGSWPRVISSNPAWQFYWLLTECPVNKRPLSPSRIDIDAVYAWAIDCTNKGLSFNAVIDQPMTLQALIQSICIAGRAQFIVRDGKYSIVRDVQQSVPVQHFTPRNSWGFQGSRVFPELPHALVCKFTNPAANWQQDELYVYADGYSENGGNGTQIATKFENFDTVGITDPAALWKIARYHMAVAKYRPSEYKFQCDMEHLVCQRGDLIKFNHDVIRAGKGAARIKSFTSGQIVLDDQIQDMNPGTYGLRIRKADGTNATVSATTTDGQTYTCTTPAGVQVGDLVLVGDVGFEAIDLIVTRIQPAADLTATIYAVDAATQVYSADSNVPADVWNTDLVFKEYEDPPAPPSILVAFENQASLKGDSGDTVPELIIGYGGGYRV